MNIIPAHYTEVLINLLNNPSAKSKIDTAMSTYPLYQSKSKEEYIPVYIPTREELNNKILNYYKYREIGFETFGRFLQELETALIEIMPYYNQLYFSADQDFNVTYNVDYKRTIDRDKQGTNSLETTSTASDTTTTNSNVNNYGKNISSKTPQGNLDITAQNMDNVSYADEVSWNKNQSSDTATSTGNTSTNGNSNGNDTEQESTIETTKGNFGVVSAQDLILKYRETILNIDQMIINDPRIQELFMMIY
jgi:hypothetical protein